MAGVKAVFMIIVVFWFFKENHNNVYGKYDIIRKNHRRLKNVFYSIYICKRG
nr:MAG TPA: hypothetical protein [Caudoviricetes sp.]